MCIGCLHDHACFCHNRAFATANPADTFVHFSFTIVQTLEKELCTRLIIRKLNMDWADTVPARTYHNCL
jgi:hypothetical protein